MAEHIDKQAAIDALTERNLVVHMDSVNDGLVASCHRSAQRIIANIPAADVRPVVHGKWIMNNESKTVCSLCGNVVAFVSHPDKRWDFGHFCPNCGADMRVER